MSFRAELGAMVRLALPIVAVQLGQMLMGVVDTIMVGHVSAEAIAAVALGNLYFFGAAIFGMGAWRMRTPPSHMMSGHWMRQSHPGSRKLQKNSSLYSAAYRSASAGGRA